ncbi:MAG: bifunctional riboflavin kinase/FAD synthetase [Gammaproteobacteria bacterium]|nr:bifunctional riboflavin kinase/FAD synthetase [Gammaproteobacteria bacterium]
MELIRGQHNIRPRHRGCVCTIGNFDGVHLGHQSLLAQVRELAAHHGKPSLVILFEPQSAEYFRAAAAPARLTRLRDKVELLRAQAIDRVLVLHFNDALVDLTADAFVTDLLLARLEVRALVVGDNFRFGRARGGDIDLLRRYAKVGGFDIVQAARFEYGGERVSSTRVRARLQAGELDQAAALLGRPYTMSGRIVAGQQRGRHIGFPTINLALHRRNTPLEGIFAARVRGLRPNPVSGAAYIGRRPTVAGEDVVLEVHLFDFAEECYGRFVEVEFVAKLRDDMKFESIESLRRQISADTVRAREVLCEA